MTFGLRHCNTITKVEGEGGREGRERRRKRELGSIHSSNNTSNDCCFVHSLMLRQNSSTIFEINFAVLM